MTEKANSSFLEELPQETPEQYNASLRSTETNKLRKKKIRKIVRSKFRYIENIDGIVETLLTYEWKLDEHQYCYYEVSTVDYVCRLFKTIDENRNLFPLTEKLFAMFSSLKLRDRFKHYVYVYQRDVVDFCFDLGYGYSDNNTCIMLYPHKLRLRKGYYSKSGKISYGQFDFREKWEMYHNYIHNYIITV